MGVGRSELKISRSKLKRAVEIDDSWLQMSGSGWEWMEVGGNE